MPETYRCVCGNKKWLIFSGVIECSACGRRFEILDASRFNDVIEREKEQFDV